MRDYQTPKKENSRFSDLGNRGSKEPQSKKSQKIAKRNLNGAFTSVSEEGSPENSKKSIDFSPNSEVSESNCELVESSCFSPHHSVSLAASDLTSSLTMAIDKDNSGEVSVPCRCNESRGSTSRLVEADIVASLLRQAQSQVSKSASSKKLLDSLIKTVIEDIYNVPEERDSLSLLISMKVRVVISCFFLWIFAVLMFFFFSLDSQGFINQPPPT